MIADTPVIAIDGPAASGKGTVAVSVAAELGFHYLDSGALYRLIALQALTARIALDDQSALVHIARTLDARFGGGRIVMAGDDLTDAIRAEAVASAASRVAVYPPLRAALVERQRAFRLPPGLVAEGRDMGTVIFPDARLKVFITASAEERARRRYKQLIEKGLSVTIESLLRDIQERDQRDRHRVEAPLEAAADALVVDTTNLVVGEVIALVLRQSRSALAKTAR